VAEADVFLVGLLGAGSARIPLLSWMAAGARRGTRRLATEGAIAAQALKAFVRKYPDGAAHG